MGRGIILPLSLIHIWYGLSEASPVISSNTPGRYRFGSSGILVKPIDLKVCDEEGQELPQGQKGELWIKGGNAVSYTHLILLAILCLLIGYDKNTASSQQEHSKNNLSCICCVPTLLLLGTCHRLSLVYPWSN